MAGENNKHKGLFSKRSATSVSDGKDLRHLSREALVEIIYDMKLQEEELRAELEACKEKLASREIRMAEAGSIAEAALALNDIFTVAQQAADDYLQSVKRLADENKR